MAGAIQTIFQGTLTATGARQAGHEKLGVGPNWIGHHHSDQGNSEEPVEVADKGGMISRLIFNEFNTHCNVSRSSCLDTIRVSESAGSICSLVRSNLALTLHSSYICLHSLTILCTATKNLVIPSWEKGWLVSVFIFEV
jgi:hypothetical protein